MKKNYIKNILSIIVITTMLLSTAACSSTVKGETGSSGTIDGPSTEMKSEEQESQNGDASAEQGDTDEGNQASEDSKNENDSSTENDSATSEDEQTNDEQSEDELSTDEELSDEEQTDEKSNDELAKDDRKDTEEVDFDLYKALVGWEFELAPTINNESGNRTYIDFEEGGKFSGSFIREDDSSADSEDYPSGGDGLFTGKLGDCEMVDEYTWKATIEEIDYDVASGTAEEYSTAKGLEGYDKGALDITFHLPGKNVDDLPSDVVSEIFGNDFGAFVGTDMDWVFDTPQDLPFYCMSTSDGCFAGINKSAKNALYIINREKFPGVVNQEMKINSDGTYYCVDSDEKGKVKIINTCFEYDGFSVDVKKCIKEIYGDLDTEYITVYGDGGENDTDDWIYKPEYHWINGELTKYATWSVGDDDYVYYGGRFTITYINNNRYAFAYIIENHGSSEVMDGEVAAFALGSLSFSGRKEDISCAGGTEGAPYKRELISCKPGTGRTIKGDYVEFVTEEDTEKIEKYGLDPNDFANDYQIGGYDNNYEDFEVAEDCPIYVQYASDGMHRYLTLEEFNKYLTRYEFEDGILMNIVLDKDGTVVLIKEPYTP